ncbi:unnamed protein product [Protopolystoma xenopodis]|uniref:Uncharacterized protein n=1 Tax=Protopolystoma xenopodis TaxID=117903 RepID=A0A3S5AGZ4_9PLAT|nr:unnamed protein product [Protopolystoma xenopodis]
MLPEVNGIASGLTDCILRQADVSAVILGIAVGDLHYDKASVDEGIESASCGRAGGKNSIDSEIVPCCEVSTWGHQQPTL